MYTNDYCCTLYHVAMLLWSYSYDVSSKHNCGIFGTTISIRITQQYINYAYQVLRIFPYPVLRMFPSFKEFIDMLVSILIEFPKLNGHLGLQYMTSLCNISN